jgi:D-beta-D-heptose 7-phosphate kinase/D-beta-D-heptose 1-phosphate adenosyltransferase
MVLMERERAREIIFRFKDQEVLVIGDGMLDQWVWGKVNRISPEAPVPIVEVDYNSHSPGGAANVVNNICSLGARSAIISVVGNDETGVKLRDELCGRGVDVKGLLVDSSRPTTTKIRIIANNQQVVRTDIEKRDKLNAEVTAALVDYMKENLSRYRVIIISDYNKGLLVPEIASFLIQWCRENGRNLVAGPKPENMGLLRGATMLTLNEKEARHAVGEQIRDKESLERVGFRISKEYENQAVLITRGEKGMSLFSKESEAFHIPAIASEVFDVSGAGDTVLSVIALSLASGATLREATILSNFAAAVVVKKIGTATLSISELIDIIDKQHLAINF